MSEAKTICLVGLGLIGGSLAASLKAKGSLWRVLATDRRRSALAHALERGFIDEAADSLEKGVKEADLVLLSVPVRSMGELLGSMSQFLRPGQIVTDVGNTKVSVVEAARRTLPAGVPFVGGHPLAGAERSGIRSALAGLFEGRTCILTPEPGTDAGALDIVTGLWRELGSEVIYLTPENHDRTLALISHLPHVVAYSLMNTVATELPTPEMAPGGTGLRDFMSITRSAPQYWRDACLENQTAVLRAIDAFISQLNTLRAAIARGDGIAVGGFFEQAAEVRRMRWTQ